MAENTVTQTPEIQESEKKSNKERLKDITDSIENGIKELFESDKYKQYLQTMSRFHKYSVNNQMLIYMQKPSATLVAGFNKWHDQFERNVKKGEKGIKIIAPTPYKKKIEEVKFDPDTKLPMLDDDGNPITVEKEIQIPMFRVVSVFDVSQTDGKPLPQLASDLSGNVQNYEAFMEAIKRSCTVPIFFEPIDKADGYFSLDEQKIVIRLGMSEIQTVSALLHEMAHAKLHNEKIPKEKLQEVELFGKPALFSNNRIDETNLPQGLYCYDLRGSDDDPGQPTAIEKIVGVNHAGTIISAVSLDLGEKEYLPLGDGLNFLGTEKDVRSFIKEQNPEATQISRNTEEVQAESISFAVCAYYGIKTDDNSFGYIAAWSKGKELPELKASLETINKASSEMISSIDRNYAEILKEQGLDKQEQAHSDEQAGLTEAMYEKEKINERAEETKTFMFDMPDKSITIDDMNAYGYQYDEMLPLTKDTAMMLFRDDAAVYLLYDNDTEAMAVEESEIENFDGIFGIEKQDWDKIKDNYLKNAEMSVEDDYNMIDGIVNNGDNKPTVAELESDVKEGKPISLLDLANAIQNESEQSKPKKEAEEKPSLLAKLTRPLPSQQDKTQPKSNEREM